jgi:hypothetical protein
MLDEPILHFAFYRFDVIDSAPQQHPAEHRHIRAGHYHFNDILRVMNSARGSQDRASSRPRKKTD